MESFEKILYFVAEKLKSVGAFFLFGMALLTSFDIIGRLFKHPIFGSVELVSFMGVLAISMALPYTHEHKGHIGVELFFRKLPRVVRNILELITEIISLALFVLLTWRLFLYSFKMKESGELSMNLQLPEYALIFIMACCVIVFSLVIVKNIIKTFLVIVKS